MKPQVNETLVLAGVYQNGQSFSYSWTLRTEDKNGTEELMTYEEAKQRLYNQVAEGIEKHAV